MRHSSWNQNKKKQNNNLEKNMNLYYEQKK